jgi:hypothetical protein
MAQKELDPGAAEVQAGMTTTCAILNCKHYTMACCKQQVTALPMRMHVNVH